MKVCDGCQFFDNWSKDNYGYCRINPPVYTDKTLASEAGISNYAQMGDWPTVRVTDWCSKWEKRGRND